MLRRFKQIIDIFKSSELTNVERFVALKSDGSDNIFNVFFAFSTKSLIIIKPIKEKAV